MLEALTSPTNRDRDHAHDGPQTLPLCAPVVIAERSLAYAMLSLAGLVLVVAQVLVNGAVVARQAGAVAADAAPEAAVAPAGCSAPVVTREAFAAWADGLISRRSGHSQ